MAAAACFGPSPFPGERNPGGCCEAYSPMPRHFSERPRRKNGIALTLPERWCPARRQPEGGEPDLLFG